MRYPFAQGVLSWDVALERYTFSFDGYLIDAKSGQAQLEGLLNLITSDKDAASDALRDYHRIDLRRGEKSAPVTLIETSRAALLARTRLLL